MCFCGTAEAAPFQNNVGLLHDFRTPLAIRRIHVHRAAHAVGFQLSRRSISSRGISRGMRRLSNAGHGHARPGWPLWRSALSSCGPKTEGESAYRGRDHFFLLSPNPIFHGNSGLALPRISLLSATREGYQNLCRLVTRMKLRAPKYPAAISAKRKSQLDDAALLNTRSIASIADLQEYSTRPDLPDRRRRRSASTFTG